MSDLNTIVVVGRLTQEPTNINSQRGGIKFSIANNGFKPEDTTFFNCTWFGERASKSTSWLTKGKQVAIQGRMTSQKYNDKLYWTIVVNDLMPTGSKTDSNEVYPTQEHLGAEMAFNGYSDDEINKALSKEENDFEKDVIDMFGQKEESDVPF